MNFRDRNYMITSSSMESLKGVAFLSKILGILRGKRVPTPHAELVAVVNRRYHNYALFVRPTAGSTSDIAVFHQLGSGVPVNPFAKSELLY